MTSAVSPRLPEEESPKNNPPAQDDLEDRLARLRSRIAREGRNAALEKIDRAIEEARRSKPRES